MIKSCSLERDFYNAYDVLLDETSITVISRRMVVNIVDLADDRFDREH